MDENYGSMTGGITGGDQITSTDFDYDVYSGQNAQDYLRQENERKRKEREDAGKSAGMRKREEYEKRFAGMSPDELFGMPVKKKKPEDDFSDFFDADEIERQKEKVSQFEKEVHSVPKVESMMPGEDTPSSQPSGMTRDEAMQAAAVMFAHGAAQRERDDQRYHNMGRTRYYRGWFYQELLNGILDAIGVGDTAKYYIRRFFWYLTMAGLTVGLYAIYCSFRNQKISAFALLWAAVGGLAGGLVWNYKGNGYTLLTSLSKCIFELAILVLTAAFVLISQFT
ncbi:MAG: hypothetical protein IJR91_04045 [Ruminococcus sp.]|nr:hypothetical protein [Ruminococcus sp.]